MDSSGLNWTAVAALAQTLEAVVVTLSAIIVIYQLRRMRQESIENKVSGVKAAVDVLSSERFRSVSSVAMAETSLHGDNWRFLLDQVNLVALLINEKYTDERLLLSLKGHDLAEIESLLRTKPISRDLQAELNTKYANAYAFLSRAREWKLQNQRRA